MATLHKNSLSKFETLKTVNVLHNQEKGYDPYIWPYMIGIGSNNAIRPWNMPSQVRATAVLVGRGAALVATMQASTKTQRNHG